MSTAAPTIPNGLIVRGKVYWISKKISGVRHQLSTGCTELEDALRVFRDFMAEHTASSVAGAGRRVVKGRAQLPKGLYWKGNVIWLSRTVDGTHHNLSTGTNDIVLVPLPEMIDAKAY